MSEKVYKIGGVVLVGLGSVALYASGTGEQAVIAVVGAVFVLAGLVAGIIKG